MRARDQSSIFSTGRKFHPDYGFLLELRALTLVASSYALFVCNMTQPEMVSWTMVSWDVVSWDVVSLVNSSFLEFKTILLYTITLPRHHT